MHYKLIQSLAFQHMYMQKFMKISHVMKMCYTSSDDKITLSQRQQQELTLLKKHLKIESKKEEELRSAKDKLVLSKIQQYDKVDKQLVEDEQIKQLEEIDKKIEVEMEKLQQEDRVCSSNISQYLSLIDDVKENVPHSQRQYCNEPNHSEIHEDMAYMRIYTRIYVNELIID